jgi:hypothetical protein
MVLVTSGRFNLGCLHSNTHRNGRGMFISKKCPAIRTV